MKFSKTIIAAALSVAVCATPITPAQAMMATPSYSQALNGLETATSATEIRHRRHARRYARNGGRHRGYARHGKRYHRYARNGGRYRDYGGYHRRHGGYRRYGGYPRYGGYRRYGGPSFGLYIAPPPVYVTPPPIYVTPPVYAAPGQCGYWASRCAARWSRRSDYIGCMRYQGCY